MRLNSSAVASLRYFAVAARTLSFRRAARELHVTAGAVSQRIKRLEEALGCKLFERLPRQIALTDKGRRLATVVEHAFAAIEREVRALAERSQIDIRIRTGPSFALRWLVPRLGDLYARHPNMKLFVTATYGDLDPAQRDFDLAIELIREQPSTLNCEFLMEEYLIPVCTPEYLARHAFLRTPEDLAGCTLLHDGHAWVGAEQNAEWQYWLEEMGAGGVDSTQGRFFSLANLSIEAALTHQGVAMGRAALIHDLLSSRQLVMPVGRPVRSPMSYWLVFPKEMTGSRGLQSITEWLKEQAAHSKCSLPKGEGVERTRRTA